MSTHMDLSSQLWNIPIMCNGILYYDSMNKAVDFLLITVFLVDNSKIPKLKINLLINSEIPFLRIYQIYSPIHTKTSGMALTATQ